MNSTQEGLRQHREQRLESIAREVRQRIIDMIYKAQSGHPGGSLSCTDILTALYFDTMKIDPKDPKNPSRDRFILSKGHACPAWYACLAMKGFFGIEHLDTLRKYGSILQGHPDMKKTPGIDMTTGSLGHGASVALGMALEGRMVGAGYRVFCVLGDGELDEGIVWEAALCAAKYRLGNLIYIVDYNHLQIDGTTDEVMPLEPLSDKFVSFGFRVLQINGNSMKEILDALDSVQSYILKPTCIIAKTTKGKGISFMENSREWHGKAPNAEEYKSAMIELQEETVN